MTNFIKPYKLISRYKLLHPEKYIGDITEITIRSSWESRVAKWFDTNPSVIAWNSESITIPYFWEVDGKQHRYFVDFIAKIRKKDGSINTYAIEIKPEKEMRPPSSKGKRRSRLFEETLTYTKNQAKWKAARDFFSKRGILFIVLNEYDLGIAKRKSDDLKISR